MCPPTCCLIPTMLLATCAMGSPLLAQSSDFNGDGRDDLAIGSPHDDEVGTNDGSANIIYGGSNGLTAAGDQFFTKQTPGLAGDSEPGHSFFAIAAGDFNGDGNTDLAAGSPYETVQGVFDAGTVNVLYGGNSGVRVQGDQFWHASVSGVQGSIATNAFFGFALAVGDFDGDGFDDLAIGAPGTSVDGQVDAGGVHVLYGSANGLRAAGDDLFTQSTPGVTGAASEQDKFGFSLATGDFDGDGRDDLAIGIPFDEVGAAENAGAALVLYGSAIGLTVSGDQLWHQDVAGISNTAELGDEFGWQLASGDFDGDGRDDLAVSASFEAVGALSGAGGVAVLYGTSNGLSASGDQFWHQNSSGVQDVSESNDSFGFWVAAGDFDGDGRDDLAIGIPYEGVDGIVNAGAIAVLYGSASGLKATGDQFLHQNTPGIAGTAGEAELFGAALYVGDFNGDGRDDLGVCTRDEVIDGLSEAGSVTVFYGRNGGISLVGEQVWSQNSPGIQGVGQASDEFGSLASSDL